MLIACSQPETDNRPEQPDPPVARVEPSEVTHHGHSAIDHYHWLANPDDPDVIAYLEAENAYAQAMMAPTEPLQEVLFREFSERAAGSQASAPWREGDYFHYYRWEAGKEYPIYARRRGSLEATEEILVDVNQLAEGHEYTWVLFPAISPDQSIMAYAVDTVGGPGYSTIVFQNLTTGEPLPDTIYPSGTQVAWANDNRTFFYLARNPSGTGPGLYRHVLGTDPAADELVLERVAPPLRKEDDYLLIESQGGLLYLSAHEPDGEFSPLVLLTPRQEHDISQAGDFFYVLTSDGEAGDSRLVRSPAAAPGREGWEAVVPPRADVLLESFQVFRDYLVLQERENGSVRLRIQAWDGAGDYSVGFEDPVYHVQIQGGDFESNLLRYEYSSLKTPRSVYEYSLDTREQELVWREEVLEDFDSSAYVAERLFAPAPDGSSVPISILYGRHNETQENTPLLLYGYGGATVDPAFDADLFSLIDRGFSYAIAHVRGGREMGLEWERGGQGLSTRNRFTDFIAAAEFLVREGYANPDLLFAHGISSGGLLMGAVANMRPNLFKGMIAQVPRVDLIPGFMAQPEPGELGDAADEQHYRYVVSYSPYQNVEAKDYPNLLVTTALRDTQVPYWVPVKWVAKLRALKTDDNLLMIRTNLGAGGHAGASGRYESLREKALLYAFLLDLVGATG